METPAQSLPPDALLLEWLSSGDDAKVASAVKTLMSPSYPLVGILRRRVRQTLETRQMLHPDQAFYLPDGEWNALAWIFERVLAVTSIRRTVFDRGGGFDPQRGSLRNWLLKAADFSLRDWLKKHAADADSVRESGSLRPGDEGEGQTDASHSQEQRLRALQSRLLSEFRSLGPTQAACMIVKYLPPDALEDDDLVYLWRVRHAAPQGNSPKPSQLPEIREALSRLQETVAKRASGESGGGLGRGLNNDLDGEAKSASPADSSSRFRKLADRVALLHARCGKLREKLTQAQRRLALAGIGDELLQRLAQFAETKTLEQIRQRYPQRWSDEAVFLETSQRLGKATRQLRTAREEYNRAEASADLTPTPAEIAAFLNLSANAVSSALTRGHQKIGSPLAVSDEPASDTPASDRPARDRPASDDGGY